MNHMINKQLNHRTIRFFKEQAVPADLLEQFIQVAQRTATSNNLQSSSMIRITDPNLRQQIAEISMQPYLATVPELFIFLVDQYRNDQIATTKNGHAPMIGMNLFFQGAADVYLTAQNMATAIESADLGTVFFGSILNDSERLVDVLNLPPYTFPLLGLGFGYPDDQPELKPRMAMNLRVGENSYPMTDDLLADLADFDEEMTTYYDSRQKNKRSDTFTNQVAQKLAIPHEKRDAIMQVIEQQGFQLKP
ncbi:NADPH-dependent oxidoreductase [Atopobacter phocae]|uniref:NADPH-dependent oxidoreductase n=1 Tax=Atopobacter phocae TaxID=136492 RepID=UPI00046EC76A|nr:NADPH-dependent oxidoreductase [Atopobacter phocae]